LLNKLFVPDPLVLDPLKAFSPYDLALIIDRCINCEEQKRIIAKAIINHKSGLICQDCFILYKK
tara:strand:- start:244 stop:435 length:192 start_codon:yes stop_codon:yes gene_type:complete